LTAAGTALAVLTSALLGVGCGETGDTDPTPVQTFKITPSANATVSPPTTPASDPTSAATSAAGGTLTLAGINNAFDEEELDARAGSVTIEFDNRDGGVVHNIHFFRGDDADDESVAETELEVGPVKQTLTFDVQPGAYFYQCDAHPNTMSGTLAVQ
jgi:plastocyanin